MKSQYRPKKRHKSSKFDPYMDEIKSLLDSGSSIPAIALVLDGKMNDIVDDNALYTFVQSRGLRSKVTQGGTNKNYTAPHCEGCSDCIKVINTNDSEVNLCLREKRIVSKSCKTSPMWCKERQAVS